MEDASRQLSGLYGSEVYSTNGTRVGTVSDGLLDFGSGELAYITLESLNKDLIPSQFVEGHRGLKVPSRWIRAVDDVVIVVNAIERISEDSPGFDEEF